MHNPLEKGPSRALIGCNGACCPKIASRCRLLTQERHPALYFRWCDVTQKRKMALAQQIVLEKTQSHVVPFHRFWASMLVSLILQVILDCSLNGLSARFLPWTFAAA